MVKAEKLIPMPIETRVTRPSLEALLPFQGRDLEITYVRDPQSVRGPCKIGEEKAEPSHPYWLTFTMPWSARRISESTWVLDRNTPIKRIAIPETSNLTYGEDGSATLILKGEVTYVFKPEGDRLEKPQSISS